MYSSKPNIPEKNIYHKKTRNWSNKKKLLSIRTKGHDWNSPYKAQAEGAPQEAQPHQRERNSVLSAKHDNRPSADLFFWSTIIIIIITRIFIQDNLSVLMKRTVIKRVQWISNQHARWTSRKCFKNLFTQCVELQNTTLWILYYSLGYKKWDEVRWWDCLFVKNHVVCCFLSAEIASLY